MLQKTYQILTNLSCNLNCSYCYENKSNRVNDIEHIKEFLDKMYDRDFGIQRVGETEDPVVCIEFIGGESLLVPELMDKTLEYVKNLQRIYEIQTQFVVALSTNGTLLAEEGQARDFVRKWKNCLNIGFSIDGTKEVHDKCRVDKLGNGSYHRAVAGYAWCKTVIPPCRINVKATYTHDTIGKYADGVISLIKLGFRNITANAVFEEVWKPSEAQFIAEQMDKISEYIFDNNLHGKVFIKEINFDNTFDMAKYTVDFNKPDKNRKFQNHCGSCKYMTCLGFDGMIYGCNRFCTMTIPLPLTAKLKEDVSNQYMEYPEECQTCPYSEQCATCCAIPYETEFSPKEYLSQKRYCGWTLATVIARLKYKERLLNYLANNVIERR